MLAGAPVLRWLTPQRLSNCHRVVPAGVSVHGFRRGLDIGLKPPRRVLVRQPHKESDRVHLTERLGRQRLDAAVGGTDAVIVGQLKLKVEPAVVPLRCAESSSTQTVRISAHVDSSLFEKLARRSGSFSFQKSPTPHC